MTNGNRCVGVSGEFMYIHAKICSIHLHIQRTMLLDIAHLYGVMYVSMFLKHLPMEFMSSDLGVSKCNATPSIHSLVSVEPKVGLRNQVWSFLSLTFETYTKGNEWRFVLPSSLASE